VAFRVEPGDVVQPPGQKTQLVACDRLSEIERLLAGNADASTASRAARSSRTSAVRRTGTSVPLADWRQA
jgi:hypothetical protein